MVLIRKLFPTTKLCLALHSLRIIFAMLIVMVHRCQSLEGMLIASLLWEFAWHFLVPWKQSYGVGTQISFVSGPCFLSIWCFEQQEPIFLLWGVTKGNSNSLWVSFRQLWPTTQKELSCLVLGLLLADLCMLERSWSDQMRKFHLNYIWIYLFIFCTFSR